MKTWTSQLASTSGVGRPMCYAGDIGKGQIVDLFLCIGIVIYVLGGSGTKPIGNRDR
jgi:hypothetical protein